MKVSGYLYLFVSFYDFLIELILFMLLETQCEV